MTTVTKLERAQEEAWAYLRQIIGARYELWTGGPVPAGPPAWGRNGRPPEPAEVRRTSCFCAGVTNLARRAVDLPIPTLGNENFDGGVVAYFGAADPARHRAARRQALAELQWAWGETRGQYRRYPETVALQLGSPGGLRVHGLRGGLVAPL